MTGSCISSILRSQAAPASVASRRMAVARCPLEKPVHRPGVDDRSGLDPGRHRLFATETEPFELSGRMGVGIDAEAAAELDGQAQEPFGRVPALRA